MPHLLRCALIALATAAAPVFAQAPAYPETPRKPVIDSYPEAQVADEYRWLEDGKDPAVRAWSEAQLGVTRGAIDGPLRSELQARFKDLMGTAPLRHYDFHDTRGGFFAMRLRPPQNQPSLVVMKSPADVKSTRVLLDLNALDSKGRTAIDFFVPSLDGRHVAVVLSENGSEDGSAHVIDARSGKRLADVVPRVQYPTGGGSIAWDRKGAGFFYTRYPQGNERSTDDANFYQQVWYHKLGTPSGADTYAIGKEFPRIAETQLESAEDSDHILARVANGDGGEFAFFLRGPGGSWTKVADFADKVRRMELGRDGRLYALCLLDGPAARSSRCPCRSRVSRTRRSSSRRARTPSNPSGRGAIACT
jgi:prolyl oligopeptidase